MLPPATAKVRFRVEGMGAAGARERVEATLQGLPGVVRVRSDPVPPAAAPASTGTVTVVYQPGALGSGAIADALVNGGFVVHPL